MRINPVVLLIAVNVLIIGFNGILTFSDLNIRNYSTISHSNTRVISVEYGVLSYRPTYQYFDKEQNQVIMTQGSWTFDFLQFAILVLAIVDTRWIYAKKQV